jgi:hypothetical protein
MSGGHEEKARNPMNLIGREQFSSRRSLAVNKSLLHLIDWERCAIKKEHIWQNLLDRLS